jgi:KaiC/GvpD/RAD55 family RecA-like ATPase
LHPPEYTKEYLSRPLGEAVLEIADVARRGMTLIYGPPGSGKTSIAIRLASRVADKILWISTTEGPDLLREAAKRVGADPNQFDFYDFPRAFRQDIAKYILDHIPNYGAAVVDSVTGMTTKQTIDVVTHSALYQIAKEKPIILIAEEDTPSVAYIADHVIHVWYRKNSLGHYIRYIQLEKSRLKPPGPRYIFDIVEGAGIAYIYPIRGRGEVKIVEDERLGATAPLKSTICIHSEKATNLLQFLEKIREESIFIKIGHWTAFKGLKLEDEQEMVIKTFHDFFVVWQLLATGKLRPRCVVIGGLLNLSEEDRAEYLAAISGFLDYADYLLLVSIGPRYETQKMEKYCVESIYV